MSDVELAKAKLQALVGRECQDITAFVYEGIPASKARARFSYRSGRFYTPTSTESAEQALTQVFGLYTHGSTLPAGAAILAVFYRPNRQRIDADNMMKLVMDAATKAKVWKDDCYVFAQASCVEMDPKNPRTVIAFCSVESSMDRDPMTACISCGKSIKSPRQTCSPACRKKSYESQRQPARCSHCNKIFRRKSAAQKLCSKECKDGYLGKTFGNKRPAPKCLSCGGRVSRREYVQCTNCAPKGRKVGSKNKVRAIEDPLI